MRIPLAMVCTLVFAWASAAPGSRAAEKRPAEVRLEPGQTLEDLAEQLFEDRDAADELRVLNGIVAGAQPATAASLKLPGPEREQAQAALRLAAQALQQAKADGAEEYAPDRAKQAQEGLHKAELARAHADYTASQRLADEAWALARMARQESLSKRPKKNRFAVSVDSEGTTRVEVAEGDGVKVTADKKTTTVGSGQAVQVHHGEPPEKTHPLLPPPDPVLPNDGSILVTPSIYFRWQAVEGASRYVLLISRDSSGLKPVRQLATDSTTYLYHSTLADGTYYFFLRTVDAQGLVGQTSPSRHFTLQVSADGGVRVEPVLPAPPEKGP